MWTYDRPTAVGYYWAITSKGEKPELVFVDSLPSFPRLVVFWYDFPDHWTELAGTNGWHWWPEVIKAPEAPE